MTFKKNLELGEKELHLIELLGLDRATELMAVFRGYDYITVPHVGSTGGPISKRMNEEVERILSGAMGGDRIIVTNLARKLEKQDRALDLVEAIQSKSMSASQIAEKFDCTPRWVRLKAAELRVVLPRGGEAQITANERQRRRAIARHQANLDRLDKDGKVMAYIEGRSRERKPAFTEEMLVNFGKSREEIKIIREARAYLRGRKLTNV